MSKETSEIQFAGLTLDPESTNPMYIQLYDLLRQAILTGRLRPGQRLPPTRTFAGKLNVSRNTVLLAYDSLWAEGYLKGKVGSGTYVTDAIPEKMLHISHKASAAKHSPSKRQLLSKRGKLLANTMVRAPSIPQDIYPFRYGISALNVFPFDIWARIAAQQWRSLPYTFYGYGEPAGYRPLREAVARYLRVARAVKCEVEQVIIVNGSQQALDLTARVLLDPGDTVWIEDPCYLGAKAAMTASGIRVIPIPVDEDGLNVEIGKKRAPNAPLIYVTPSHQFPLGVTLSLSRRLQLLDWANQSDAWIIEDDYDSEYRYAGRPLSSLQGLDVNNRVIYIGTFSKVLFPAMRLAYLVVPPDLVEAFCSARAVSDRTSPLIEQVVLSEFIAEGYFGRHIRRMRTLYQERQEILVKAVKSKLSPLLQIEWKETGMHTIGWLPEGYDDQEISLRAFKSKINVSPLSAHRLKKKGRPGLILGYAPFSEKEIYSGINRLAKVLDS